MRRLMIGLLTTAGCLFIAAGILLLHSTPTYAQGDEDGVEEVEAADETREIDLEYVGADRCSSCHRDIVRRHADTAHALALQSVGRSKAPILADFDQGEDVRTVQFPGEDEPRPFTEDDIAFVIGAGRYTQKYVYEVGRREYQVFPAQWNTVAEQWESFQLAESWPDSAYDFTQNCAGCHTVGLDVERGRWIDDGVQCEACHGPANVHIETARDAGRRPSDEELVEIRGAIKRTADPQVCGQCHSRGMTPEGSPSFPTHYQPGGTLVEDGVYTLFPPDDAAHWYTTGHARQQNMQFNEWFNSAHAASLTDLQKSDSAADECLYCHSQDFRQTARLITLVEEGEREGQPPDPITLAAAQWGVTCTTCHNPHSESEQPFDLVEEANQLCVSCHTNPQEATGIHHPVKEMFEGVTLISGIDGVPGTHFEAEGGPVCLTCHMPDVPVDSTSRASHTFRPILPGEADEILPNACAECHEDLTATDLQLLVEDTQAAVRNRLSVALARLGSVSEPEADSSEAAARYEQVIAALNFVQNDGSLGIHNYAYTDALLSAAELNLSLLSVAGASLNPTEAPAPTATPAGDIEALPSAAPSTVPSGVRPITIIVIGFVIAVLAVAAVVFFRKPAAPEMRHE